MDTAFTDFSARKLRQLTARLQECAGGLSTDELWRRATEEQNSIGNLLLHLAGNVRQWIVAGIGGAEDIREREREFSTRGGMEAGELLARLEAVIEEAVGIIERLTPERLAERVRIQRYDLTVLEAVYHVVEHFSQHTGQVIVLARLATGANFDFYGHLARPGEHGERTP